MYFHALIKIESSKQKEFIFKNLSERQLLEQIVKPYKFCRDFYHNGEIVPIRKISNIAIIKTTETTESMEYMNLKEIEKKPDDLEFIAKRIGIHARITYYGKKVTNAYLTTAPCQGTLVSNFLNKIKHPVLVRIISLIF